MALYTVESVTLGTAARLTDVDRFDMRDVLRGEGVEFRLGPEDVADAREDIDAARDLERRARPTA